MSVAALRSPPAVTVSGLAGLGLALVLRVRVAGAAGAHSVPAGVVFGIALLALAVAVGFPRPAAGWRQLCWGVGGAAVLCVPAVVHHLAHPAAAAPAGALPVWAAAV